MEIIRLLGKIKVRFCCVFILYLNLLFIDNIYANQQIRIIGSSTVFPYAKIVADKFHEAYPRYNVPVIESGGTGAGVKEFCTSDDDESLDIVNASRPMNEQEYSNCCLNGVKKIHKVTFGYDAIVLALNKKTGQKWQISPVDIYRALAEKIVKDGKIIENNISSWQEANSALPKWSIECYIPGEKHGTREVFEQKLMLLGCQESGAAAEMKKLGLSEKQIKRACIAVRKDNKAIEVDGDYSEILARLEANSEAVGFLGLAFYENNLDKLNVALVNGIEPNAANVASGLYALSRPLYFYVKDDHLRYRPGLKEYVNFFLSDAMIGEDGDVVDYGLVPLPLNLREQQRQLFKNGIMMQEGSL